MNNVAPEPAFATLTAGRRAARAAEGGRGRLHLRQLRHRLSADHRRACGGRRQGHRRSRRRWSCRTRSAAMGMAHGYYLATGRAQAVIAHTNVGLANCAIGAINAAVERVPVLLFSGRTPTTEKDRFGARTVPIGWGQEMRDQTALVREACQVGLRTALPRAGGRDRRPGLGHRELDAARAGLCQPAARGPLRAGAGRGARRAAADGACRRAARARSEIAEAARMLAEAEHPVIFAQHGAGSAEGVRRALGAGRGLGHPGLPVLGAGAGDADRPSDGGGGRSRAADRARRRDPRARCAGAVVAADPPAERRTAG